MDDDREGSGGGFPVCGPGPSPHPWIRWAQGTPTFITVGAISSPALTSMADFVGIRVLVCIIATVVIFISGENNITLIPCSKAVAPRTRVTGGGSIAKQCAGPDHHQAAGAPSLVPPLRPRCGLPPDASAVSSPRAAGPLPPRTPCSAYASTRGWPQGWHFGSALKKLLEATTAADTSECALTCVCTDVRVHRGVR